MQEVVMNKLREFTKHDNVRLTDRGNSAIFIALSMVRKENPKPYTLIPDQGGWISYRTYPKLLKFEVKEIKTDRGVIDLEDLEKEAETGSALLVSSFAGYFAEQPIKSIAKICKTHGCLLVEDASGAVGDEVLCNGRHSDVIIGSFGKWKPMNLGYGGFISARKSEMFEHAKEAISMFKVHQNAYKELMPLLNKERLGKLLEKAAKVKKEIKAEVFHKDKRGLNVVTEYKPEIIKYCDENKYQYVLCPTYIRVNEKAISIELKRL